MKASDIRRGHGMVASKGFLRQYDQRQVGVGALGREFTVADAGDHLSQAAASDPDVPAEHYQGGDRRTRVAPGRKV